MPEMKAAQFSAHGGPEVVEIARVPRPEPGRGAALIRVGAAGMNHLDLWVRRGLPIETTMPHIGGSDVAGTVERVGDGVDVALVGARVVVNPTLSCGSCEWCLRGEAPLCVDFRILGEHTQGGFAEYVTAPAANLLRIPDALPFERAAAAPLPFLTAWRGLMTRGRLRAGESVLVTGASGGVASAAVQIAKLAGATVFAVTTTDNVERVRGLGADHVYDRNAEEFDKSVWHDTHKRGVDLVFDSVGAATWTQCVRSLARLGRLVVYGATTGPQAQLDLRVVFWKQIEVIGTTMSTHDEFEQVMRHVLAGDLTPVVDVVWPLERAAEAHQRLERGEHFGKIVLVP